MISCGVRDEDIIAYDDGYLAGGRKELVEAHLASCRVCQDRLTEFREVTTLIRATDPAVDSHRTYDISRGVRQRIHEEKAIGLPTRTLRPVVLLLALIIIVATFGPAVSDAGSLLGDFVQFRDVSLDRGNSPSGEEPVPIHENPTPIVNATPPENELLSLPLELVRIEQVVNGPDQLKLQFRNENGLEIQLERFPAMPSAVVMDPDNGSFIVPVLGTSVLVMPDPRPNAVAAMFWEQDGTAYALYVMSSWGGLILSDATNIVAAVMEIEQGQAVGQ